ncbi:MAG: MsnO8 family LLM class oxidoreductase, partial [Rhodospirillales bacterium]|nr:MsnO8 family LLM class oxidoreductase [Rhodospirillales bacterium]
DLGLGRAPGSDGKTAYALNPNAAEDAERFPANVLDLMAWVSGQPLTVGHPHQGLVAKPQGPTSPEIWMLGTSDFGAQVAAHFGIPYCFAHFITDGQGVERAMQVYRQNYKPSAHYPEPIANICVWALAAETEAEAEHLFSSRAHWKVLREKGDLRALQSPETAAAYEYTDIDKRRLDGLRANAIIGTGASVYKQLDQLADKLGIDEAVVLTWTFDQADRRNSYRLLAEEQGR